jgi:hypothetical protein
MRKILLVLMVVLGLHLAACAQATAGLWSNLSVVRPGQRVRVVDSSPKPRDGSFRSFSDSAIVVVGKSGEFSVPRQDVRSVRLMSGLSRSAHAAIGAAIGAGAGAGIGAANSGKGAAIGAFAGAAAGALIGAALPVHNPVVFAAPLQQIHRVGGNE